MTDESKQPQNQKHNEDSPEHMFSFELVYFASHPGPRLRLKFFRNSSLSSRGGTLWWFKENAGGSDLEWLQRQVSALTNQSMRAKFFVASLLALSLTGG